MDLLSRIAGWLGENEATISAVVGITVLAGVLFAGLRSLVQRRGEAPAEKVPSTAAEPASAAEASAPDLDPRTAPGLEGRPAIAVPPSDGLRESGLKEQSYVACSACGHENPDHVTFCGECGTALARLVTCSACGRESIPGQKFCHGCGSPLSEAVTPTSPRDPLSYTPQHLADKILQSRSALEGERKQVTALFADVKDSIDLAEQVDPEEWLRIMERFFQILAEAVHRYEGTINQYTGGGVMALFGAAIAHEDHARRACYAALRIRDSMRRFAEELRGEHGIEFGAGIGLNSGDVIVEKIGDDLRMDYTAQGKTVGIAVRVQRIAEPGDVYLTEHTAHLVEGFFELRDLPLQEIEGMREPVRVHALEGVGRMRTRLELAQRRGLSAFVGREKELGLLEGALEQALAGRGQIVGVVGEAGVGKSRLCLEFVLRCQERGLWVNEAHCPSHGKTEPFGAILQLLRGAFGLREEERDAEARARVAGRLAELDAAFEESLPLVFDFLGMPDPERPAAQSDPQTRERRLHRFVGQLVQARSRQEPAVVLLDDAHWIDEPSDGFLAAIARAVSGTRTLLLVNFRPEYSADWMSGSDYQQLPVRPLGPEDADALLRALMGDDPAHAELFARIREETGGNPFFLEEVVRSLAESGALEGEPGAYRLAEPVASIAIPETVQTVLEARIDRLPEREKHLLQTAAVIGKEVPEALLATVSELPEMELDAALESLRRAEFLYETSLYPEVVHAFKHPLTQQVAYDSQLRDRRMRTHAAVASALEDAYRDRSDEHTVFVAQHWARAGERLRAAEWYLRAWDRFWLIDHKEARRCSQEVLALLGDATGLEPRDARRAAGAVIGACSQALFCGWSLGISREEADALLERALHAAGEEGVESPLSDPERSKLLAELHMGYGHAAQWWNPGAAIQHSREGYALAKRSGDTETRLQACNKLVHVLWASGGYREAWELAEPEVTNPPTNPLIGGWGRGTTPFPALVRQGAMALAHVGQPREALRLLEYAASLFRTDGRTVAVEDMKPREEDPGHHAVGEDFGQPSYFAVPCYYFLGDAERAWKCAQMVWERCRRSESHMGLITGSDTLGTALRMRGEWAELARVAREMVALIETAHQLQFLEQRAHAWIAESRAHLGEPTAAIGEATAVLANALDPVVLESCVRTLLFAGGAEQREAIETALEKMAGIIEWTGGRVFSPFLHELRAQLALVCGDADTCESERREAERLWTEMGAHGHIERMAQELAELRAAK